MMWHTVWAQLQFVVCCGELRKHSYAYGDTMTDISAIGPEELVASAGSVQSSLLDLQCLWCMYAR